MLRGTDVKQRACIGLICVLANSASVGISGRYVSGQCLCGSDVQFMSMARYCIAADTL